MAREYLLSDEGIGDKTLGYSKAGKNELIDKAHWLRNAAQSHRTPARAKILVYAVLGYFVLPVRNS